MYTHIYIYGYTCPKNYQCQGEVYLRYKILYLLEQYGTRTLVIIEVSTALQEPDGPTLLGTPPLFWTQGPEQERASSHSGPLGAIVSLTIYLSIYKHIYPSIHLSTYLSTYLSIHLSIYLSTYLPIYLSID